MGVVAVSVGPVVGVEVALSVVTVTVVTGGFAESSPEVPPHPPAPISMNHAQPARIFHPLPIKRSIVRHTGTFDAFREGALSN